MRESIREKTIDITRLIDLYLTYVRINITELLDGSSFILSAYFTLRHTKDGFGPPRSQGDAMRRHLSSRESRPDTEVIVSGTTVAAAVTACLPASPPLHPSCSRATDGKSPWPMIDVAFKIVRCLAVRNASACPIFRAGGEAGHMGPPTNGATVRGRSRGVHPLHVWRCQESIRAGNYSQSCICNKCRSLFLQTFFHSSTIIPHRLSSLLCSDRRRRSLTFCQKSPFFKH